MKDKKWIEEGIVKQTKREPEVEDLGIVQPFHIAKSKKACSAEDTKGMAEQQLDKKFLALYFTEGVAMGQIKDGCEASWI